MSPHGGIPAFSGSRGTAPSGAAPEGKLNLHSGFSIPNFL
jgi:hypothetical protein